MRSHGGRAQHTIQPALFAKEANFAFGIASNETDDHRFLLATLKPVDRSKLNARKGVLERG